MYARQGKSIFTCSNRQYQFDLHNYLQYRIMPLSADISKKQTTTFGDGEDTQAFIGCWQGVLLSACVHVTMIVAPKVSIISMDGRHCARAHITFHQRLKRIACGECHDSCS